MTERRASANWKWLVPVLVFAGVWFLLEGRPNNQQAVGAIFAATVSLWILEIFPLTVTSLLSTSLLVLVASVDEKTAFGAYGDPIIPLFIGSFILAKAMEVSGLSARLAWMILRRPGASKTPGRLLFSIAVVTCVLSLFVSNTATTAMMLPIGLSILAKLNSDTRGGPFAVAMMLTLTYASSVAVGTTIGTPPNLLALSQIESATGYRIGFAEWMIFGMPITLALTVGTWALLKILYGKSWPSTGHKAELAAEELKIAGKLSPAERHASLAFFVTLGLWMGPDLVGMLAGDQDSVYLWLREHLTATVAALIGASILFIGAPQVEGKPVFGWAQARSIDWGTIMLFGGGIALGQAMFASGLAKDLGEMAAQAMGTQSIWAITALCTAAAILMSELSSNTASASTLLPVSIGLSLGAGVNPIPAALGVALGASLGFMLPVSTAPNAIVFSSGLVPSKIMIRNGVMVDVLGFLIVMAGLYLTLPAMGLTGPLPAR
ncbi:MAG TPA: DASS family sodium-coupled anion symporter [Fimbriimonadaceae bacterium]|nr:DASS family sodium-coupled anion symporter [Fimbriimonadaceae bacterium]HRJ32631.1 DASS family sodium-coupled anion symporter [Fimbriimonadaceae bacterium]